MTVGRKNYLLVLRVKLVESVEKFFLSGLFFRQKLHVVYYKHVHVAVFVTEIHSFLRIGFALADSSYKVAREFFARCVKHVFERVVLFYVVRDGVHDMRFAKPRAAVNEQRIIAVRRIFGNGFRRCVKIAVGWAYHERVECVFRVNRRRIDFAVGESDALSRKIIFVAALNVKLDIGYARA